MTDNRAFREYATRVSFNMTLSRNQIYALRCILLEIEHQEMAFEKRRDIIRVVEIEHKAAGGYDNFIGGGRALARMGLVENDPRWVAENQRCDAITASGGHALRKYWGPSWQLTEAGRHVVALLQIAGLIHLPSNAANANKRERRRA